MPQLTAWALERSNISNPADRRDLDYDDGSHHHPGDTVNKARAEGSRLYS